MPHPAETRHQTPLTLVIARSVNKRKREVAGNFFSSNEGEVEQKDKNCNGSGRFS